MDQSTDAFTLNIEGARDLVGSSMNKTQSNGMGDDSIVGDFDDILTLNKTDEELLDLERQYKNKSAPYTGAVEPRQKRNKLYYKGLQRATVGDETRVVPSNLIFEAEETFLPQALSQNPEPVVWSDDTDEGKAESNDLKTMLQYHADVLCLRKKLGVMLRHWSIYFIGVAKHGWDEKAKDIKTDIRRPINFILDPDGYIDEYGNYIGDFLGEKIESTAEDLIELFPEHKAYIVIKVNGKLGTKVVRTEWWNDDYCFITFADKVLDKYKNPYFNYETKETDDEGNVTATPGQNHFASPKMPYTFLSVFSLQEQPHDITNLIEQNISNQDMINDRDDQILKNLKHGNNSMVVSGQSFDTETAKQAADAAEKGDPILVPDGNVDNGIKRLPASQIPDGVFQAQQISKDTLRGVFGTQGLTAQPQKADTTARGMILNQSHDSSRIGGGVGDSLEQVADNIFNWWAQLYYVFYDEPHYGAILGSGRAVEYVMLVRSRMNRNFVISVAPGSMKPKDEITKMNLAVERWNNKSIDPITFMKEMNSPDPMEDAKKLALWNTNPQLYIQIYFPESSAGMVPDSANPLNPPNVDIGVPQDQSLSQSPASPSLSQVPISTPAMAP